MIVDNVMTREVFSIAHNAETEGAAAMLTKLGVSGAPVVSDDGTVVGVISQSDLTGTGLVEDYMTATLQTIDSSAPVAEAGRQLVDHDVHRLLVLDEGKLVGIVSSLDILRGLLRQQT